MAGQLSAFDLFLRRLFPSEPPSKHADTLDGADHGDPLVRSARTAGGGTLRIMEVPATHCFAHAPTQASPLPTRPPTRPHVCIPATGCLTNTLPST